MEFTLQNLKAYQVALAISDLCFEIFGKIPRTYHSTGNQFLNAADSVGANIAEGYGRGSFKDRKNFFIIARGSLYETSYWLNRLQTRNLVDEPSANKLKDLISEQAHLIYGYIKYLKSKI